MATFNVDFPSIPKLSLLGEEEFKPNLEEFLKEFSIALEDTFIRVHKHSFDTDNPLSAGDITCTAVIIGANTLNTNEWAVLDGVTANMVLDWTLSSVGTIDASNIEDKFLRNDASDETSGSLTMVGAILSGDLIVNGGDIGLTADTNLMQLAANILTVNGDIDIPAASAYQINSSDMIKLWPTNQAIGIGISAGVDRQRSTGVGYRAGEYSTGDTLVALGWCAGGYNRGEYLVAVGKCAGEYNEGDANTAIGDGTFNTFPQDAGNAKTFDNTDINISTERITITSHGFGANDSYKNLYYTEGTSAITGMTNYFIYRFKIIDANTLELDPGDITNAGSGTGHTLTPQYIYTNSTALGHDANPDASNQIMLGDSNVTQIKTAASLIVDGGDIGLTSDTDLIQLATGTVTVNGNIAMISESQLRIGSSSEAIFIFETRNNNSFQLGLVCNSAEASGYFSLMEAADLGNDNRSPLATSVNPVLRIYSSDVAQALDYGESYHDQTDFINAWGNGDFIWKNVATEAMRLTSGGNLTLVGVSTAPNFISSIATGTSPYACTSITLNTNLNADLWDGYQFADYLNQAVRITDKPTFAGVTLTRGIGVDFVAGSAPKIDITHDMIAGESSLCLSMWAYVRSAAVGEKFFWFGSGGSQVQINSVVGSNFKFHAYILDSGNTLRDAGQSSSSFPIGALYHIVYNYDGTNLKVYINNVEEISYSISTSIGSNDTYLQLGYYSTSNFDGIIDEVALWAGRSLGTNDISDLYNSGDGLFVDPANNFPTSSDAIATNLAGLWHMDEDASTTITDSSGNSNDGTASACLACLFLGHQF